MTSRTSRRTPILLDGDRWPRPSEHYFQAQKFLDRTYRGHIRAAKSPMIAARLGRSRTQPLRPDWESVKLEVMLRAVSQVLPAQETGEPPSFDARCDHRGAHGKRLLLGGWRRWIRFQHAWPDLDAGPRGATHGLRLSRHRATVRRLSHACRWRARDFQRYVEFGAMRLDLRGLKRDC